MEVRPKDLDQANRKTHAKNELRKAERAQATLAANPAAPSAQGDTSGARLDPSEAARYVEILKTMGHSDQKKLEDLRKKIEDGSYKAEVDDLVQPLLHFLGRDGV
jgi:anti-sigma28 factor (negative regulator of flagellin synthesis)